jgi:hypothetical protein
MAIAQGLKGISLGTGSTQDQLWSSTNEIYLLSHGRDDSRFHFVVETFAGWVGWIVITVTTVCIKLCQ